MKPDTDGVPPGWGFPDVKFNLLAVYNGNTQKQRVDDPHNVYMQNLNLIDAEISTVTHISAVELWRRCSGVLEIAVFKRPLLTGEAMELYRERRGLKQ